MRLRTTLLILALLVPVIAALAPSARADVQVQEKITFDGFGGTGWGANVADTTTRLSGDRLQQESTSQMIGKLMKFVPGLKGSHTGTITRLDKGMLYAVNYEGKSYTEMTLAEMGAQAKEALSQMAAQQPPPPEGEQPPEVDCDPAEFSATNTGEKKDVVGLSARLTRIEGRQTCRNKETKEACTISYVLSLWNAPVQGGLADLQAFMVRQAKAMGFDMRSLQSQTAAAGAFLPGGSAGMEAAIKELRKIEGYPVSTTFEIFADGGCGAASAEGQGEAQPASDDSADSGMKGMKKLFSKFKKKDDSSTGTAEAKKTETAAPAPAEPGKMKLFGLKSEMISLSSSSVPAEHFEVPAGFKKEQLRPPPKS